MNQAFMAINGSNELKSVGYNRFARRSIFYLSDPSHLIKKLRNNILSSGFGDKFTRTLCKGGNYILWAHIRSAYERDRQRYNYFTKLRKSHMETDSLSKMRVKLAVETLSPIVAAEMENSHEVCETASTQQFIRNRSKLWEVFNDANSISSLQDARVQRLREVTEYFEE